MVDAGDDKGRSSTGSQQQQSNSGASSEEFGIQPWQPDPLELGRRKPLLNRRLIAQGAKEIPKRRNFDVPLLRYATNPKQKSDMNDPAFQGDGHRLRAIIRSQ